MKRLVILCDGTWNAPDKGELSNVLSLARGLSPEAGGVEQVAFYDWGVGTDRKTLTGGISGAGIDKNILDCYRFIIHNYNAGDQLFFFGFSRGAYTVRSLAGLIRNCGVLKKTHAGKISEAYRLYRKRSASSGPDQAEATKFRSRYAVANLTRIEFVGVWDTVGALGIPVPFWGTLGEKDFLFHDTEPSKIIRHARHALSIDERREDFLHTAWTERPELDIQQVWFAGAHSDVGGGYAERGLSDCALRWMLAEAHACGLRFDSAFLKSVKPDPSGKQHNSRRGIFLARPTAVRDIDGPVHESVKKRWLKDAGGYRKKSRSLARCLESVDGDWSKLAVVGSGGFD